MVRNRRSLVLLTVFALTILIPAPALAVEILNSATVTPPCTDNIFITWSNPATFYVPLGLDQGSVTARCPRPLGGTSHPYARTWITSAWPSAGNGAWSQAHSGMGFDGFVPGRAGQFAVDFDVTFSGQAGLYVPRGPDFWGGADALVNVNVVVRMYRMVLGLPQAGWEWSFPVVDVRINQGSPIWVWNERRLFTGGASGDMTLVPGESYAATITLGCYTEANTVGSSGGATAWVNFEEPLLAQGFIVHAVTVRDLNPDTTGPVASLGPGSTPLGQSCVPLGGHALVYLQADDGSGYGVASILYNLNEGGGIQTYHGPISLGPGEHGLEYWAVDRVGNQGSVEFAGYELWTAPAAPTLYGIPDGSVAVRQPVVFYWESPLEASSSHLQIDDDPAFGSPAKDLTTAAQSVEVSDLPVAATFYWRVQSLGFCGAGPWSPTWTFSTDITTAVGDDLAVDIPARHMLFQNHPNPFNPMTNITLGLAQDDQVTLRVYTVSGQLVRTLVDGPVSAGYHEIPWNGTDDEGRALASGVYIYRARATGFEEKRSMTLLR